MGERREDRTAEATDKEAKKLQKVMSAWAALDQRRRIIVILAGVAILVSVITLARMAAAPSMALLYGGLDDGSAGEIISALEQRGVAHEVRGGAIFVDASQRDALRMTLASEGLPANASKGYELLDGLTGFGTTSQMFDAAYWRAKEGELARTIVANPAVRAARVHIASTGSNPFQRDVRPTASVALTASDAGITAQQARALRFLVASAVAGMMPEDVSVIDDEGGLIGSADEKPASTADSRANALRQRVARLLEARVGAGNAVVEVSVDTVTRTEQIRERRIEPDSRVAISVDSEERSNTSSDKGGGDVTVASNLPQGEAGGEDTSQSQSSESRERINYEVSQTEREIIQAPGAIRRLTVAVLVNGTRTPDPDGTLQFEPRPEAEMAALRDLVASAVGFDEARGDVITLKTMEFEPTVPEGTSAEASLLDRLALDVMSLIQAAVLGLVALLLGIFVLRPLLLRADPPALPRPAAAVGQRADTDTAPQALTGEIEDDDPAAAPPLLQAGRDAATDGTPPALRSPAEDPVARLRGLIGERQDETVEILRSWLEEEKAS